MEPKSPCNKLTWREELLEGCVAFTTPLDACNSALVSKTFRSAADSDALRDKLLPQDLSSIVSRCSAPFAPSLSSKKELFFSLCYNPILIDDSKKLFFGETEWQKCYMLAASDLMIAWGGTPQYWKWINLPESRFAEVAELEFVWWLEIRGKIGTSMLSTATSYVAYLVFKLRENAYGLDFYPTAVSVGIVGGKKHTATVCLVPEVEQRQHHHPRRIRDNRQSRVQGLKHPTTRGDGWLEIELGEYYNQHGEDGELEMSVMEVNAAKAGVIVQGIEIRPKIVEV